ncbi:MAG: hypothetical protein DLM72_12410 [Candidatus Nitrosopolaris wilkensis]|nr:MAG: hypothetical protein DLM72_12410 [Candidatus Nitrosopolaris wilkensis]
MIPNVFDMNDLPSLILIASIIGLSILTTNWYFNSVIAVTIGGASVIQEQVNTGNPILDKEINKFYSCISKTHQDPPTKQIVDDCYSQNSIAGITGPGNHNHNNNNNNIQTPSIRIATPPPGVLVEVP